MTLGDLVHVRVDGHNEPIAMLPIVTAERMNAGSGIALVAYRQPDDHAMAQCMAASSELLAYALCEEARTRGEDIAETVLRRHGFDPRNGTAAAFMDSMRRAAIAKATGSGA